MIPSVQHLVLQQYRFWLHTISTFGGESKPPSSLINIHTAQRNDVIDLISNSEADDENSDDDSFTLTDNNQPQFTSSDSMVRTAPKRRSDSEMHPSDQVDEQYEEFKRRSDSEIHSSDEEFENESQQPRQSQKSRKSRKSRSKKISSSNPRPSLAAQFSLHLNQLDTMNTLKAPSTQWYDLKKNQKIHIHKSKNKTAIHKAQQIIHKSRDTAWYPFGCAINVDHLCSMFKSNIKKKQINQKLKMIIKTFPESQTQFHLIAENTDILFYLVKQITQSAFDSKISMYEITIKDWETNIQLHSAYIPIEVEATWIASSKILCHDMYKYHMKRDALRKQHFSNLLSNNEHWCSNSYCHSIKYKHNQWFRFSQMLPIKINNICTFIQPGLVLQNAQKQFVFILHINWQQLYITDKKDIQILQATQMESGSSYQKNVIECLENTRNIYSYPRIVGFQLECINTEENNNDNELRLTWENKQMITIDIVPEYMQGHTTSYRLFHTKFNIGKPFDFITNNVPCQSIFEDKFATIKIYGIWKLAKYYYNIWYDIASNKWNQIKCLALELSLDETNIHHGSLHHPSLLTVMTNIKNGMGNQTNIRALTFANKGESQIIGLLEAEIAALSTNGLQVSFPNGKQGIIFATITDLIFDKKFEHHAMATLGWQSAQPSQNNIAARVRKNISSNTCIMPTYEEYFNPCKVKNTSTINAVNSFANKVQTKKQRKLIQQSHGIAEGSICQFSQIHAQTLINHDIAHLLDNFLGRFIIVISELYRPDELPQSDIISKWFHEVTNLNQANYSRKAQLQHLRCGKNGLAFSAQFTVYFAFMKIVDYIAVPDEEFRKALKITKQYLAVYSQFFVPDNACPSQQTRHQQLWIDMLDKMQQNTYKFHKPPKGMKLSSKITEAQNPNKAYVIAPQYFKQTMKYIMAVGSTQCITESLFHDAIVTGAAANNNMCKFDAKNPHIKINKTAGAHKAGKLGLNLCRNMFMHNNLNYIFIGGQTNKYKTESRFDMTTLLQDKDYHHLCDSYVNKCARIQSITNSNNYQPSMYSCVEMQSIPDRNIWSSYVTHFCKGITQNTLNLKAQSWFFEEDVNFDYANFNEKKTKPKWYNYSCHLLHFGLAVMAKHEAEQLQVLLADIFSINTAARISLVKRCNLHRGSNMNSSFGCNDFVYAALSKTNHIVMSVDVMLRLQNVKQTKYNGIWIIGHLYESATNTPLHQTIKQSDGMLFNLKAGNSNKDKYTAISLDKVTESLEKEIIHHTPTDAMLKQLHKWPKNKQRSKYKPFYYMNSILNDPIMPANYISNHKYCGIGIVCARCDYLVARNGTCNCVNKKEKYKTRPSSKCLVLLCEHKNIQFPAHHKQIRLYSSYQGKYSTYLQGTNATFIGDDDIDAPAFPT